MPTLPAVPTFFDELAKIGAVSDAQARRALKRYEALEGDKPTARQVARYAGLGAVATPAIGALSDVIGGKPSGGVRGHLARAAAGALTSGAIPLARAHLDRRAEMGTLKKYIGERGLDPAHRGPPTAGKLSAPFEPVEKTARRHIQRALGAVRAARGLAKEVDPRVVQQMQQEGLERAGERLGGKEKDSGSGITPARGWNAEGYTVDLVKGAFATSAYNANLGPWRVPQKSFQPGFRAPNLGSVSQVDPQQIKTGGENVRDVIARVFDHYLRGGTRFTKAAAGAPTRGGFLMSSEMPGFRAPSLRSPAAQAPQQIVTKLGSVPTTPAGLLASSKRVGAPRVSAPPGPSIAQVAKPVGFGRPKPGAAKDIL